MTWPIPDGPHRLLDLPVYAKPHWVGFWASLVGALLWCGERMGIFPPLKRWCASILDDYITVIDGRIYAQRGRDLERRPLHESILGHEAVHHWQQQQNGTAKHAVLYALTKRYRRHAEAMAYAYEVAVHGRDPEEAARTMAEPAYLMGWTPAEARTLLDAYVAAFRVQWVVS